MWGDKKKHKPGPRRKDGKKKPGPAKKRKGFGRGWARR